MVLDLNSQWSLHQNVTRVQTLLQSSEDDSEAARNFLLDLETKTSIPSSELVALLMELSLQVEMHDKAVEFFVWGRETGHLPPVDSLLALISAVRHFIDWKFIRQRLYKDLEVHYPNYVSHKLKVSALTGRQLNFNPSSSQPKASKLTSNSTLTSSPPPQGNSDNVNWVDFVSNPSQFSAPSLQTDSLHKTLNSEIIRKDQHRQDTLQKHFGVAIGDRQRKLRLEVKNWTLDQLKENLEDNVMLTCVVEEMVSRGLEKEAVELLRSEVMAKRYLISTEPFLSLATYFKEKRNVEGVLGLLQTMMEQQLAPDIFLINILLELHVSVGNLEQANELWNNIYQFHVVPNSITIGTVISLLVAAVESRSRLSLTLSQVLRAAQKHGVELSDASFTPLLRYCVAVRNYQFALSVFPKLKSPNFAAYALILEVYLRTRQLNKFIDTYNTLESNYGRQIDLKVLKMAREALLQLQRPHSFIPLIRTQILKHGFQPTLRDFGGWIESSLRAGQSVLALQLDLLRNELCPQLKLTRGYINSLLMHEVAQEVKPSVTSLVKLREWYATTPNALPANGAADAEHLDTGETAAWNLLIKTWVDDNLPHLRSRDQVEFARIRADALESRHQKQEERQQDLARGMERLKAFRKETNQRQIWKDKRR